MSFTLTMPRCIYSIPQPPFHSRYLCFPIDDDGDDDFSSISDLKHNRIPEKLETPVSNRDPNRDPRDNDKGIWRRAVQMGFCTEPRGTNH
ncbi:hypothetical protein ACJ72_02779 [Emergomyces africanus]|uniref:Uncharacterized protein n=1 Tax=Emergomyces africanus TaxID=1955775 RepID=A0A1B7P1G5_9EURO|nr:hypothetical protein ACJ72_02779 [Emergomyces africanus]